MLKYLEDQATRKIVSDMIETASFSALTTRKPGQENIRSHFRKGIIGDWGNHFSVSQSLYVVERLGKLTRQLGQKFGIDDELYLTN